MEGLLPFLRWRPRPALSAQLECELLDFLSARLGQVLRALGPERADPLLARLRDLPDPAFIRLLIAPQTYNHLRYAVPPLAAAFLAGALAAEERREGSEVSLPEGGWTALGDRYFPPGPPLAQVEPGGSWSKERPFRAPCLPGGLPVDFVSPHARGKLPEVAGDGGEYPIAEATRALEKLTQASDLLAQASQPAAEAVSRFTRVLVLRHDHTRPDLYTSCSTTLHIGRAVMRNPHLERATLHELCDGLVHETIHFIADILELRTPFVDEARGQEARVHSPWTGRSLSLHTYLQASLVWFGVGAFWLQAASAGLSDPYIVARYLLRAAAGFQSGEATRRLEVHRAALAPSLFETISEAQRWFQGALQQLSGEEVIS